jgi:hypothetical protein
MIMEGAAAWAGECGKKKAQRGKTNDAVSKDEGLG